MSKVKAYRVSNFHRAPPTPKGKSRLPLVVGGLAVYLGVTYLSFSYFKLSKPEEEKDGIPTQKDTCTSFNSTYDHIAENYDKKIGMDETLMGLGLLRRWLIKNAKGDVLEVSAGTGRNLPYYREQRYDNLTLTDQSGPMLDQAKKKMKEYSERVGGTEKVHFEVMNVEQAKYPDNSFDTVISTFSVCSYDNPVKALSEMQRVCKPDGYVLLLEHGQSKYKWLNNILDTQAEKHALQWGCWWNRDIMGLVYKAGLQVVYQSRWHLGTTYYIIARPAPN
ncbi:S-adenosyl-L-methionine-dependent methyltransferase [Basidiobolus meristosporus CBS 931.73]|uniref:S-adenosyl-L-methionine-dependent methyltransferase n=1 Tax=Basidiobolus meristosporus CBS 931.73 TaxID=1314790 RepID=A0A1Y1YM87_9FUNG|nr:S-adenosyl-L-methionine-dependent methyltransferase [Basidiobolus meristosporus CBS 931.73]|eukprot:ORX99122.1 S-adenosyl-L-methionine-dependent methyltransferase [Basidiobolus meristosporus CBS 931.73]